VSDPNAQILAEMQRLDRQHAAEQRELNDRQQQERRALVARALLTSEPKVVGGGTGSAIPADLIGPKRAQREFRLSKASLARIGDSHPELCIFAERGRRMYSQALLGAHLQRHPLRRQSSRD
jgi:hypothetical protein